jgi:hypothetical protein
MGRWGGGIATRICGGGHARVGRPRQLGAPEMNIGLSQVVNPPEHCRAVFPVRSSRNGNSAICLLETKRA